MKRKMSQTIQSMSRTVKARVRNGSKVAVAFICRKGPRQGEITMPLLLSSFINELAVAVIKNGRNGIQRLPDMTELFILLFADDTVLLSHIVVCIQNQMFLLKVL